MALPRVAASWSLCSIGSFTARCTHDISISAWIRHLQLRLVIVSISCFSLLKSRGGQHGTACHPQLCFHAALLRIQLPCIPSSASGLSVLTIQNTSDSGCVGGSMCALQKPHLLAALLSLLGATVSSVLISNALSVSLCWHIWVVVGQVFTRMHCSGRFQRVIGAVCPVPDCCKSLVWLCRLVDATRQQPFLPL